MSVTLHTQTQPPAITGQAVTAPWAGSLVASLVPLARSLGAWLALPSLSRWLLWTFRLGYAIQFAQRPPKFRGIRFTSVQAILLAKDAIESVPLADMRSGFYSFYFYSRFYFIVPKKSSGLRPILDLQVLNRALHKLLFKMLTQNCIFECIRPQDWFAAIDLKNTIDPTTTQPFLRFAFEGRAYKYKVLPFGLSLSPCVFTKVLEAALVPLRERGCTSSSILTTSSYSHSLAINCAHTGTWCSDTLAQGWF